MRTANVSTKRLAWIHAFTGSEVHDYKDGNLPPSWKDYSTGVSRLSLQLRFCRNKRKSCRGGSSKMYWWIPPLFMAVPTNISLGGVNKLFGPLNKFGPFISSRSWNMHRHMEFILFWGEGTVCTVVLKRNSKVARRGHFTHLSIPIYYALLAVSRETW